MSDTEDDKTPKTCCVYRRKILVSAIVLSEEQCGIPDTELADIMRFDLTPDGAPILAFKFCPWCGTLRDDEGERRIVQRVQLPLPPEED